jgi:hypothetical protein
MELGIASIAAGAHVGATLSSTELLIGAVDVHDTWAGLCHPNGYMVTLREAPVRPGRRQQP